MVHCQEGRRQKAEGKKVGSRKYEVGSKKNFRL
jgi:hypothetical protein